MRIEKLNFIVLFFSLFLCMLLSTCNAFLWVLLNCNLDFIKASVHDIALALGSIMAYKFSFH